MDVEDFYRWFSVSFLNRLCADSPGASSALGAATAAVAATSLLLWGLLALSGLLGSGWI